MDPLKGFSRFPNRILNDDLAPPGARLVYAIIAAPGPTPTVLAMARNLGYSKRHILRFVDYLEKVAKVIRVERGAGRQNRYTLLVHPVTGALIEDGAESAAGNVTGDTHVTTPEMSPVTPMSPLEVTPMSPPPPIPPIGVLELREKEGAPPPPVAAHSQKPNTGPSLFAPQHRHWLRRGVEYFLDEKPDPKLAMLRDWFPAQVAEFFLLQSWQRENDSILAFTWAKQFALLNATEPEVVEAFAWVQANPVVGKFNRPDLLRRALGRVRDRRRLVEKAATPAKVRVEEWSEAEREEVRRKLRERVGGTT